MKCKKYQKLLYLYRQGELSPAEQTRLNFHIEKCEDCRGDMLKIKEMDQQIAIFRKTESGLSEPEMLIAHIMGSIDRAPSAPPANRLGNVVDRLLNWLATPGVRIGFAVLTIFITGSFFIQESMIFYRITQLEDKMAGHSENHVIAKSYLPGTSTAAHLYLHLQKGVSFKEIRFLLRDLENELEFVTRNKLIPMVQSYENLQITNRLLDECSGILGITLNDGVDPTEISKMVKNRKKIVIRFRQYLRREVVK